MTAMGAEQTHLWAEPCRGRASAQAPAQHGPAHAPISQPSATIMNADELPTSAA
jgi:hypothetical protein